MIQVRFRHLDRSEILENAVIERFDALVEKFPSLKQSRIQVVLAMENSPFQAGPDLFQVKILLVGGRLGGVTLVKEDANFYRALALAAEGMLERLNRAGDKQRVRKLSKARRHRREQKRLALDSKLIA